MLSIFRFQFMLIGLVFFHQAEVFAVGGVQGGNPGEDLGGSSQASSTSRTALGVYEHATRIEQSGVPGSVVTHTVVCRELLVDQEVRAGQTMQPREYIRDCQERWESGGPSGLGGGTGLSGSGPRYAVERNGQREYVSDPRSVDLRGVERVCRQEERVVNTDGSMPGRVEMVEDCRPVPPHLQGTGEQGSSRSASAGSSGSSRSYADCPRIGDLGLGMPSMQPSSNMNMTEVFRGGGSAMDMLQDTRVGTGGSGSSSAPAGGLIPPPDRGSTGYIGYSSYSKRIYEREAARVRQNNTEVMKWSLDFDRSGSSLYGCRQDVDVMSSAYDAVRMRALIERRETKQISLPSPSRAGGTGVSRSDLAGYDSRLPLAPPEFLEGQLTPVLEASRSSDRWAHLTEVEKALQRIQQLESSKKGREYQNTGYYLEDELKRQGVLTESGLIAQLPGVGEEGLHLRTPLRSQEGVELRVSMNVVLVTQSVALSECRTGLPEGCEDLGAHLDQVKTGLLVADRLSVLGKKSQYEKAMGTVRPYVSALKGFTEGVLKNGALIGGGIMVAAFLPPPVTAIAAVGLLGYAIYEGVQAIIESDDGLRGIVREKYQAFVDADAETQGRIVGEVTADVVGLIYGGRLASGAEKVLEKGMEKVLHRAAAREMVLAAAGAGALESEVATQLNAVVDLAPEASSRLMQAMPPAEWQEILPLNQVGVAAAQVERIVDSAGRNIANLRPVVGLLREHNLPLANRREVIEAFTQNSRVVRLTEDRTVYRYWTKGFNGPRGRWVTSELVENPHANLALPNGGPYQTQRWTIPAGTELIEGLASPNFGMPGGGGQIYVPNPGVLR